MGSAELCPNTMMAFVGPQPLTKVQHININAYDPNNVNKRVRLLANISKNPNAFEHLSSLVLFQSPTVIKAIANQFL